MTKKFGDGLVAEVVLAAFGPNLVNVLFILPNQCANGLPYNHQKKKKKKKW